MDAKRTPLYSRHISHGARMTEFGGWMLPVQFAGSTLEHSAVRERAGVFDIGHMGVVTVRGTKAVEFLQTVLTNDVSRLADTGKVLYTCMCRPDGGILDDLLVYENFEEGMMLVINGATTAADLNWLYSIVNERGYDPSEVSIAHRTDLSMIAIQGPQATERLQPFVSSYLGHLKYYNGVQVQLRKKTLNSGHGPAILSRTGYTGEDGFEIIAPADMIAILWDQLTETGVTQCGLASRDVLRLEMGYSLYGQDISVDTTPLQAGLSWTVSFKKPERFIGRDALEAEKEAGVKRRLVGMVLEERGIPRHDYRILCAGRPVGSVTSGTLSPRLGHGIALGYVEPEIAKDRPPVEIEIRTQRMKARIVDLPFYHPLKPARAAAQ